MRDRHSMLGLAVVLILVCVPLASSGVRILPAPQRVGKVVFLSGGVGQAEQQAIHNTKGYDLRMVLTRPDGAYLADVDVRIKDASGRTVLDTTTNGPFLLAQLPPGRYRIRAEVEGRRTEHRTVHITPKGETRLFVAMPEGR